MSALARDAGGAVGGRETHRYIVLDSLRGVCACMVALLHFKTPGLISHAKVVDNGFLFVDFFFVLSGFVIAASYGQRLSTGFSIRKFLLLRLGRIYPLHAMMLLVFLAFEIWFALFASGSADRKPFSGSYEPTALIYSFGLVQTFFGPDGTAWNGPSWSIAAEFWTYVVFALLFRFAGRWMVPLSLAIAIVMPIYLYFLTDRYLNVFHDGAFARCLYGFSLGVIAHRLVTMRGRAARGPLFGIAEIAAVAAVVWLVSAAGSGPLSLAAPPLFFVAILIFAQEAGWLSRLLSVGPMLLVGTLSYSIYMIHGFIQYRLVNVLSAVGRVTGLPLVHSVEGHNQVGWTPLFGDLMSIVMLGVAIAAAWVSYRLVERPMQRWSRDKVLGGPRKAALDAVESAAPTF